MKNRNHRSLRTISCIASITKVWLVLMLMYSSLAYSANDTINDFTHNNSELDNIIQVLRKTTLSIDGETINSGLTRDKCHCRAALVGMEGSAAGLDFKGYISVKNPQGRFSFHIAATFKIDEKIFVSDPLFGNQELHEWEKSFNSAELQEAPNMNITLNRFKYIAPQESSMRSASGNINSLLEDVEEEIKNAPEINEAMLKVLLSDYVESRMNLSWMMALATENDAYSPLTAIPLGLSQATNPFLEALNEGAEIEELSTLAGAILEKNMDLYRATLISSGDSVLQNEREIYTRIFNNLQEKGLSLAISPESLFANTNGATELSNKITSEVNGCFIQ